MKTIFLLLTIALVFSSCKKDDPEPANNFINTKWTAPDDIAKLIYGGTCTTSVEFLTETTCQTIDVRVGGTFGSNTDVTPGIYTYKDDSVFWNGIKGKISGSVMNTSMGTLSGGKRVYTKN